MRHIFIVAVLLCLTPSLWAAGGPCPTGSIILDKYGNLVTLASFGVTQCFYVSAAGLDTNSGVDENHSWLHSPGMAQCANTCSSTSIPAGAGIIFRGGDTWHFGDNTKTPFAGNFTSTCSNNGTVGAGFCWANSSRSGTASNYIYFGVDKTWFAGGSWVRPKWDGDNGLTPNPLVFGDFVASCSFQMGNNNTFLNVNDANYVYFDNFEMTGLCQNLVRSSGADAEISYGRNNGNVFANLYIHGWTHVKLNANGDCGTANQTSVCSSIAVLAGSTPNLTTEGETVEYCVIDGSDSDPGEMAFAFPGFYNAHHNVFRYFESGTYRALHVYHDNLTEHVYSTSDMVGHPNLLQSDGEFQGVDAIYNNVFRHVCTDTGACPASISGLIQQNAPVGFTEYIFNNVYYDDTKVEYIGIGGTNPSGQGLKIYFNNTFQQNDTAHIYGCAGNHGATFDAINNLYITNGIVDATPGFCTQPAMLNSPGTTEHLFTISQATAANYLQSGTFAYFPPSGGVTIGAGTNEQSICTTLLGNSDPLVQAAGTACQSDTTYACTYNSTPHTVTCPARTPVIRPATAPFDVGAYQFIPNIPAPAPAMFAWFQFYQETDTLRFQ